MLRLLPVLLLATACARPADPPAAPAPERPEAIVVGTEGDPEAISLLGEPLYPPAPDPATASRQEAELTAAVTAVADDPGSVEALIWLGRRTGYMWRYRDAIDIFTSALRDHPDEPRLLRHRGHRYISIRELDLAVQDLSRAAVLTMDAPDQVEPDGQPNAAGIPTSTLKTNIWYHLGLAHYLRGAFDEASTAFRQCFELAGNDDMRVAAADWLYMALQRDTRSAEAEAAIAFVAPDMQLLENHAYYRRLHMYRGWLPADSLLAGGDALTLATQGYGVGNHFLVRGDTARATQVFRAVLATGYWSAFGYIAAEADLARMGR